MGALTESFASVAYAQRFPSSVERFSGISAGPPGPATMQAEQRRSDDAWLGGRIGPPPSFRN